MKNCLLLIGGSGFIGSHFLEMQKQYKMISTYNSNPIENGIHFDLEKDDLKVLIQKHSITHVLFMGGIVKFDVITKNPESAKYINVECTINKIKETIDAGVIPVYFSSESVFKGLIGNYDESYQPEPKFEYGHQKYTVEKFILNNTDKYLILRLSKVFSSARSPASLITAWLGNLEKNEDICVAIDNIFSPIHVSEVVSIVTSLILLEKYGIYNICSPQSYSRFEMLDIVMGEFSKFSKYDGNIIQKKLNEIDGAEMFPTNTSLASEKTAAATGYTAQNFLYWGKTITHLHMNNRDDD